MIDDRSLQRALADAGFAIGAVDGIWGAASRRAARSFVVERAGVAVTGWSDARVRIAAEQQVMIEAGIDAGPVDGLVGPQTRFAYERRQDLSRDRDPVDADIAHQPARFPRQRDMAGFYGPPGSGHTRLDLPYPMRLAWDPARVVHRIAIHARCARAFEAALANAKAHYGHERLRELGLDRFGGCYADRAMRGGSRLSTHAYAAAIDYDPDRNRLRWGRDEARLARPECARFLDLHEEQGLVSLGRERNFDWMHVQAARL